MKGITELLFSRAQLVHLFDHLQLEYIKYDTGGSDTTDGSMPVKEKNFSEFLSDGLIEETHRIQDRR